jgi:hypothetical protein
LLVAQKTKPILNRRNIDMKNNRMMIDNIIEKHLKCAARKR